MVDTEREVFASLRARIVDPRTQESHRLGLRARCPQCDSDHLHVTTEPSCQMTPESEEDFSDAVVLMPLVCVECQCQMFLWIVAADCGVRIRITPVTDLPGIMAQALAATGKFTVTDFRMGADPAPEDVN